MKIRSTTPASKSLKARMGIVLVAFAIAVSTPIAMSQQASADDYDARIAALQRKIDQYQSAAKSIGAKADTLQRQLDGIKNEIAQIQVQIDLTQTKYDKTVADIKKTEEEISNNRDALGEVIADLSIEGEISPLEMLASSKNISDYVDKQTYQSSIQDELKAKIKKINELKTKLEKQKLQTQQLLGNQKRARATLNQKRSAQQELVNKTRGQEAAYQSLRNKTQAEQKSVMEAQQAAIRAASAGNGGVRFVGGGDGGYPWHAGNCPMWGMFSTGGADGNGGDGWGYGCRQCASYAAWKIGQRTGVIPTNLGNANQFPYSLSGQPQGSTARANSAGVISAGTYGHVVWVESNPDSEGFITVSQYNANYGGGWGNFSRVRVHQSTYDRYIYF